MNGPRSDDEVPLTKGRIAACIIIVVVVCSIVGWATDDIDGIGGTAVFMVSFALSFLLASWLVLGVHPLRRPPPGRTREGLAALPRSYYIAGAVLVALLLLVYGAALAQN